MQNHFSFPRAENQALFRLHMFVNLIKAFDNVFRSRAQPQESSASTETEG